MGNPVKKGKRTKLTMLLAGLFVLAVLMALVAVAVPTAPIQLDEATIGRHTGLPDSTTVLAYAGNVTELNITHEQITLGWQGFYGTVTGEIVLDDARNQSIFTWSLSAVGEVYATWNATTPIWASLTCLNVTNAEIEATRMNIPNSSQDNFTATFNQVNNHPGFNVTGSGGFDANDCRYSIQTYVNDTAPDGTTFPRAFNETVLWDEGPLGANATVYVALLNDDQYGFNATRWDFQMLVPEDGWDDNTDSITYYFYVELT